MGYIINMVYINLLDNWFFGYIVYSLYQRKHYFIIFRCIVIKLFDIIFFKIQFAGDSVSWKWNEITKDQILINIKIIFIFIMNNS